MLLFLFAGAPTSARAQVSKEYQIKAAFLYNFIRFVEWPAHRFSDARSPIVVGVLGSNPFGEELEKIVHGREVAGRIIAVRVFATVEEAHAAHLLFIPAGGERQFAETERTLHAGAVVTVGESDRFTALNGIITFAREADKVRFAINLAAAEAAHVKLSAQLLKLATDVRRKS